ncbi:hypothetical protein DWB68_15885 [Galactobacter valiniphilus]|uniref:Deoxyribonuclease NucA/NucB domain-containing protein n=1 Tax=Galactobacter valiniphilus TaxID=2676122 RepID=A0A399J6M3_9MICC|nr:hypothetical protein DWB68_15885 [Galactobacter valiniphilus]
MTATETTTKNNRRVACQSTFVKKYAKKGESCDEYPFASTNQGAAAGNNARRVPDGAH